MDPSTNLWSPDQNVLPYAMAAVASSPAPSVTPLDDPLATAPEISVVVPAYRGKSTIAACISAVEQMAQGWNHEVVVVESSGDGSADLVGRLFPEVRVIPSPARLTAGQARNLGVHHARGQWIFCVDQDCLVPDDWIPRLLHHLRQPGVGAAGGAMAVANPHNISGWCVYFLEFLNHFPGRASQVDTRNFLIGANSAWRAEVFEQVAFPDQTLGEDLLLSEMVKQKGYTVVYDPSIKVRHYNRQGWSEFRRYCRAMGRAAAQDQSRLGGLRIGLVRRWPIVIFAAPLVILPRIAWALRSAPPTYLMRYLVLLPCCLFGQLLWAAEFRAALLAERS
ncbi:MAG: glycosyltransferase [Cyanobacteriota bacterium]|nr:glycosyltransferase [Cyanobacteriota bacterium]